jgi:hypothetical protein
MLDQGPSDQPSRNGEIKNAWMDDSVRFHGNIGGCYDGGGGSFGEYYFYKIGYRRIWSPLRGVSPDELCSRTRLKDRLAGA